MPTEAREGKRLFDKAMEALELPTAERIAFCNADRWIGYRDARKVLARLDALMLARNLTRPECMLVVGRPSNGKTTVLQRFYRGHRDGLDPNGQCTPHAVWMEMPPKPTETVFLSALLRAMSINHPDRDSASSKAAQAVEVMQCTRVSVLIIDELSNLVSAGKAAPLTLAAMRNLTNLTRIPIVAGGTMDAQNALRQDAQLNSRFVIMPLDRWTLNADYRDLLATVEKMLPLHKASNLHEPALSYRIYSIAGETIGGTIHLLRAAATEAILSGREMIDEQLLDSLAYSRPGDWTKAAQRV